MKKNLASEKFMNPESPRSVVARGRRVNSGLGIQTHLSEFRLILPPA
jgi:hypothetical protein